VMHAAAMVDKLQRFKLPGLASFCYAFYIT
jgi:hypothetical protein